MASSEKQPGQRSLVPRGGEGDEGAPSKVRFVDIYGREDRPESESRSPSREVVAQGERALLSFLERVPEGRVKIGRDSNLEDILARNLGILPEFGALDPLRQGRVVRVYAQLLRRYPERFGLQASDPAVLIPKGTSIDLGVLYDDKLRKQILDAVRQPEILPPISSAQADERVIKGIWEMYSDTPAFESLDEVGKERKVADLAEKLGARRPEVRPRSSGPSAPRGGSADRRVDRAPGPATTGLEQSFLRKLGDSVEKYSYRIERDSTLQGIVREWLAGASELKGLDGSEIGCVADAVLVLMTRGPERYGLDTTSPSRVRRGQEVDLGLLMDNRVLDGLARWAQSLTEQDKTRFQGMARTMLSVGRPPTTPVPPPGRVPAPTHPVITGSGQSPRGPEATTHGRREVVVAEGDTLAGIVERWLDEAPELAELGPVGRFYIASRIIEDMKQKPWRYVLNPQNVFDIQVGQRISMQFLGRGVLEGVVNDARNLSLAEQKRLYERMYGRAFPSSGRRD